MSSIWPISGGSLDLGIVRGSQMDTSWLSRRNDYQIFYEEWLGLTKFDPGPSNVSQSPWCDIKCRAHNSGPVDCECGAQEFYWNLHRYNKMVEHVTGKPCGCPHCRPSDSTDGPRRSRIPLRSLVNFGSTS